MIRTTVNISLITKVHLIRASQRTGLSNSELVMLLIKRIMKDHCLMMRHSRTIQYQDRQESDNWWCMHIKIDAQYHDIGHDMRKFFKMSVSFIIAVATAKYLSEIVRKHSKENYCEEVENYPFHNYAITMRKMGSVICWKIWWGVPNPPTLLIE